MFLTACHANTDSLEAFVTQVECAAVKERLVNQANKPPKPQFYSLEQAGEKIEPGKSPLFVGHSLATNDRSIESNCQLAAELDGEVLPALNHPIEMLKYRGFIEHSKSKVAIIEVPEGHLMKVSLGEVIGQSNGKVTQIMPAGMVIEEWIPTSMECLTKKTIKLSRR